MWLGPLALLVVLGLETVAYGADRAAQAPLKVKPGQVVAIPVAAYSKVLVANCGDGIKHEGPTASTFEINPEDLAKRATAKPTSAQFQRGIPSVPITVLPQARPGSSIIVGWTAVAKGCFSMNGSVTLQVTAAPPTRPGKPKAVLPCVGPSAAHTKLMAEPWKQSPVVLASLRKAGAWIQSNREEAPRRFAFDEFSITIDEMPPGVTPEQFLEKFARNPNAAANNPAFDVTTRFKRREHGPPRAGRPTGPSGVGTIYDIDIPGPPNSSGSVVLVEKSSNHFIVQTITVPEKPYDRHPVSGAREFGFTRNPDGSITFYTRGADRPDIEDTRIPGAVAQNFAWTQMMKGIGKEIDRLGGKARSHQPYFWRTDTRTGC